MRSGAGACARADRRAAAGRAHLRPGRRPDRGDAPGILNRTLFAGLFDTSENEILVVNHPHALAVKVSLPRPSVQGDQHDSDCYAGQQYAPLMELQLPELP
ncbi:DUF4387 family protein [Streptomyces phaeochromogenes]|uniref:DUF4387 family protein n=1 Tax=Streptomyces phaeochromogenes TaxID=1923 RepID=UPI0036C7D01A